MIDLIGLKRIGDLLLWYNFYIPENGGGIWLGARYAQGGERNPEPIKGLSHAATVTQICRFYYMLANGELISPECSRQMLQILSRPALHDKFVSVLEKHVSPDRMFRKSGDWNVSFSDSVLVCETAAEIYTGTFFCSCSAQLPNRSHFFLICFPVQISPSRVTVKFWSIPRSTPTIFPY